MHESVNNLTQAVECIDMAYLALERAREAAADRFDLTVEQHMAPRETSLAEAFLDRIDMAIDSLDETRRHICEVSR